MAMAAYPSMPTITRPPRASRLIISVPDAVPTTPCAAWDRHRFQRPFQTLPRMCPQSQLNGLYQEFGCTEDSGCVLVGVTMQRTAGSRSGRALSAEPLERSGTAAGFGY